jgi:predicted unusual protein kinase regulating ubiquinone biosynthesis (AarF/ABC1/UbiB family)
VIFQAGPKVTFLDLGLVAKVDTLQREALSELFFHITQNNGPDVARIMFRMSPTQEIPNYQEFEDDISAFISEFYQKSLGEVEITLLLSHVFRLIRRHRIRCQPDYTLINVAFLTMEGIGKKLDPTMDLFEQAQPFLAQHFLAMAQRGAFSNTETPTQPAARL